MNTALIEQAALQLRRATESGTPCSPVRELLPAGELAAAYAVQHCNTRHWQAQGRRIVGAKTGLTSQSVQRQLGVSQPDFGVLFADMCLADGATVFAGAVLQPKVEAEVAFVLGQDIDQPYPTLAEVIRALDYALPALEIVGSRISNWDISILDTIADNASSGLFVLGNEPRRLAELDLRLCGMALRQNGNVVASGAGLACLGHPLNAVVWLAQTLQAHGTPLRAGDIVLSGALGPMASAGPGDFFEARINGLGSVRTLFSANPHPAAGARP